MASEKIDRITIRYSVLQSLSATDIQDSLEWNICHTQAMSVQIAAEMSRLQEEPTQQVNQASQVPSLQEKDQQVAEVMEEEMAHEAQVLILSDMHLQQTEEVRAQSQEIWHLSALVKKKKKAIEHLSSPKSPTRELRTMSSHSVPVGHNEG